jgi:hypothetical protein
MSVAPDQLPYIDEHSATIAVEREATWEALLRVVEGTFSSSGPRPLAEGSTLPGFHVTAARPPEELALAGSHRFSNYALTFCLDELGGGATRVRAETRAEFPGAKGGVYRTLVIGTRIHVLVTRRVLAAVRASAERA